MKNFIPLAILLFFLSIPMFSALAITTSDVNSGEVTEQAEPISAKEQLNKNLSLKEKFLLKRLEKKGKKFRGGRSGDEGFAVASMVLGILALLGGGIFLGIIAIVMAAIAFKRMRLNGENQNRGMAIAGLVTGIVASVFTLGAIGLLILIAI